MDDNEIDLKARIEQAVGDPKKNVEYLEDGIGPNFRVAIAPNGYIWFNVGVDLVSTQGYCDSKVARAMSRMLASVADEYDRIQTEVRAIEGLKNANNMIQLPLGLDSSGDIDAVVAREIAMEHEVAVDDAVVAAIQRFD